MYEGGSIQRWTVLVDETRHYTTGCADRAAANQDGYKATLYDQAADVAGNKPVDGNLTEMRTHTTASLYQKVRYGYDDAGRMRWTEDANRNRSTTTYSPENTWPLDGITTTTPKPTDNNADLRGPLSTTVWKSRFWGVPYQSKDTNGKSTKITLDAAGRTIEVWKPTETGSSPSLKFSYSIPASPIGGVPDSVDGYPRVATHTLQSGTTYLSAYAYTDGLGRARETQAPIRDGTDPTTGNEVPNRQVAVTRYDTAGHVTGTSAVFRNQGTAGSGGPVSPKVEDLPSYTDQVLDWAGRTTKSELLVGDGTTARSQPYGRVTTSYHGDYTTVTPAAAGPTDSYTDVYGQTSKIVEHNGSSTFTTQYTYTAQGSLQKITDSRGNETLYTYDWAGQRIRTTDPDAGWSTTEYDANGQISKATSNGGRTVLTYAYDNLGRKTSVTSGTNTPATWTWDGLGVPGGKGRITATTSTDTDGTTYTVKTGAFDDRGRPLRSTVSIPASVNGLASDYTTSFTYDAADHLTTVSYPAAGGLDAETVTTTYNAYGQPVSLASGQQTYVKATLYDAYGLLTDRSYGSPTDPISGVAAQRSYSYYYANGTRWLRGITTTTTVGPYTSEKQEDLYYQDYDGKITELREQASGQTAQSQCFRYDDQARLTSAYTRADQGGCSLNSTSDFTGQAPYQSAYTHDRLGNLQSVTDIDATGKATTRDYLYPGYDDTGTWTTANAAKPHGVRKINHITAGSTTRTDTFTYDAAGQMTQRIESGTTTDYTWTSLGQLSTVKTTTGSGSELTRYTYDADGNLLIRTTPEETVATIGGMELRTTNETTATATRYYTSGTSVVAMRTTEGTTTANGKLTYLMADTQASTQLAVDATTGTTTRRRYTPFGDERNGTLPKGTDSGFLGKTEDTSTGLSLLGARAYDPHLGRFLSPDPLTTPYNPQNLSAFSYSANDPINYADPSGMILEYTDGSECEGGWDECGPGDLGGNGDDGSSGGGNPVIVDLGDGESTLPPKEIYQQYQYALPGVGQLQRNGVYSEDLSYELMVELYFRERCSESFNDGCSELRNFYGGWKHVDSIDAVNTCLICGNIGFQSIVASLGARGPGVKWKSPCSNCFPAGTDVLMADGTTKDIEDISVGDKVQATDPETNKTGPRAVTRHIITEDDKHFNELSLATDDGIERLTATHEHPFWSPSEQNWVETQDLNPGMTLFTDEGNTVIVTENRPFIKHARTYNLTVAGLHSYYVLAGATPILVHNSGPNCGVPAGGRNGDRLGGEDFHGSDYSLDEMVEFVNGHTGGGNPAMGRPSATEVETTLRQAGPRQLDGQNSSRFDHNGVRVIINWDMPWKSTSYYPGR
ncbi:polymorphic toxin-type HINT domain-containing protein [Streptomyces sp. R11]|uniref:Polymorphic toxin-type HINT domain-containing protein n=1 Tax=Streptomyces sp. R11 TaxID=3238625 RepID=A0AB39NFF3_9ACTN